MTPNPKAPRFIRNEVPAEAPQNMVHLYDEYQTIKQLAKIGNWPGVLPENFVFEYSTYDNNAEILFKFIDKNQHIHRITVAFYGDSVSTACWFSYLFKADNFYENAITVQSFAEYLMVQLWDKGIDANLCNCDWGLEFTSSIDEVALNMNTFVNAIVSSLKPMEWFYSDETIWKFYPIHSHLLNILPQLQQEAKTGRWRCVRPENFTILRDKTQAYIVLTYQEPNIYDMTFKVGFNENGFDPDVSGKLFACEYNFSIRSNDSEVSDYYVSEQKQCCKIASTILDIISYNALFAYDQEDMALAFFVDRKWAFQKYCQMLDVVLPVIFKHEASKPLVTQSTLGQKAKLESLFNTSMEIVEDKDSKYIFDHGEFLAKQEDPNTIYNEDLPF
ncbi:MAG: hypothetical protein NC102_01465 [Clostridium sp.]|nr:hypothetical protein [Clostridium sp.]